MTSHILFDFFGTLVDYSASRTKQGYEQSHRLLSRADGDLGYEEFLALWSSQFDEFERKAEESSSEFSMTDIVRAFLARVLDRTPPELLVSEFADLYVSEWNKGVVYPRGIQDLLRRLERRFDLAIITNTDDPALVPGHLARMGVSVLFPTVVTSVEHGFRKPHPAIFEHTLEILGIAAEDCVYVGDSFEVDYLGAQAVGIHPLLIDPSRKHHVPATARLDSVFALEQVLPIIA